MDLRRRGHPDAIHHLQTTIPANFETWTAKIKMLPNRDVPRVTLKLRKPRTDRKVQWSTETVDNENMNKKKSKCCCIYEKPRKFGESSSEDSDDECDHCHGHVDRKKKNMPTGDCVDGGTSNVMLNNSSQTLTIDN